MHALIEPFPPLLLSFWTTLKFHKNEIFLTLIYYFKHNTIHLAFNKPQSHKNPHNIRSNKLKFKISIFG
jgi:hypothetical protein